MGLKCYSLWVEWSINAVLVVIFFSFFFLLRPVAANSLSAFILSSWNIALLELSVFRKELAADQLS